MTLEQTFEIHKVQFSLPKVRRHNKVIQGKVSTCVLRVIEAWSLIPGKTVHIAGNKSKIIDQHNNILSRDPYKDIGMIGIIFKRLEVPTQD